VTGKVQKFRMRETAIAELGLQSASAQETAWARAGWSRRQPPAGRSAEAR